ncbi:hypothetical protein, partial [Mesorhizobium sp.]|uniref:hypothetical protein n=1 Tax=Mesorhizobium sp. TaxID=1871066 RepID=UPI0025CE8B86
MKANPVKMSAEDCLILRKRPRCWNQFCGSKKAPALGRRAGPSGMYELPACPVMIVRYHNEQTV